jgi:hypothetical protein
MSAALPPPISREAGDKTKGFRFQKLRAAVRLLQRIGISPQSQCYCAMEFVEDSAIFSGRDPVAVEENKQYSAGLSFNSDTVKNSIVAFLDADATFGYSQGLRFGFYASATIADERLPIAPDRNDASGRSTRSYQLLRNLASGVALSDEEASIAKDLIEVEYRSQYPARDGMAPRTPPVATWTAKEFRSFLEKIDWTFTLQDNDDIEKEALELVRKCPFFDYRHEGLEGFLLSAITDLLEKRSHAKGHIDRIVGTSDIKGLFSEILALRRGERLDPAHEEWENEHVDDRRNLSEKVLAVSPDYSSKRLARLARRIALARHEGNAFGREYVSLLLRVLNACQEELDRPGYKLPNMSEGQIDACIDALVKASTARMNALSSTWTYRVKDEEAIRGAVLSLFNDCYLAFDHA